jgi:inosine-uridine nucleoside N-ribohydrolase
MEKKMKKLILLFIVFQKIVFAQAEPARVIFDSDMGPDYDDVGAIAILHALADSGYAKILATCTSTKYEGVAGVMNVFNTYFNRPNIPVGVPKGKASTQKDWQHWTDTVLAKYTHRIMKNSEVPNAVEVYRKVLAKQPEKSVTIVTVGFLTNLAALLNSGPDKYSKLSGKDLVLRKVKRLVSMAGRFPSGREFNVYTDSTASNVVSKNWPTEILFDGFEIGSKIKTGLPLIENKNIAGSPVKDVFKICIAKSKDDAQGRMSWDEIAVLVAVKGYNPWFTLQKGKIIIKENGSNEWDENSFGHFYIKLARPVSEIETVLNNLMMHQPKK